MTHEQTDAGPGEGTSSWPHWARVTAWLLIATGVGFRLGIYLHHLPLWHDEAALALNILGRSLGSPEQFLEVLDYNQAAPAGFMGLARLCTLCLGPGELALRLVPLLASIASLVLFHRLLRRMHFEPAAALVALALFACSWSVVRYAAEAKPYSVDVLVALVIIHLCLLVWEGRRRAMWMLVLVLAGLVATWFSFPALFVLGGAAVAMIVRSLSQKRFAASLMLAAVAGVWVAGFSAYYFGAASFVHTRGDTSLSAYWSDKGFLPVLPRSRQDLDLFIGLVFGLFRDLLRMPEGHVLSGLAMATALIGALSWPRRRWPILLLLVLPLGLTLIASMLHKYPLSGRLVLFLYPCLAALMGGGMGFLLRPPRRLAGWVIVAMIVLPTVAKGLVGVIAPPWYQDIRPEMAALGQGYRPGDAIFVHFRSMPCYDYLTRYTPDHPLEVAAAFHEAGLPVRRDSRAIKHLSELARFERLWGLFSFSDPAAIEAFKRDVAPFGTRAEVPGSTLETLLLYEMSGSEMD